MKIDGSKRRERIISDYSVKWNMSGKVPRYILLGPFSYEKICKEVLRSVDNHWSSVILLVFTCHRHLFHTWATLTNKTRFLTRGRTPLASMAYISIILYLPLYTWSNWLYGIYFSLAIHSQQLTSGLIALINCRLLLLEWGICFISKGGPCMKQVPVVYIDIHDHGSTCPCNLGS